MTTNDPDAAAPRQQPWGAILDDLTRLAQQIENSKQNLICARADEPLIRHALDRMGLAHMVNLHTSSFCPAGQVYATPSHDELFGAPLSTRDTHVYARDVHSGAGNCVCGGAPGDTRHVQIAPGVDVPDWMRP